jgi:membrane protease YdiL (CAAX protease family)
MNEATPSKLVLVTTASSVTLATIALGAAVRLSPSWADVLFWSSASVALCAGALVVSCRVRFRALLDELGLLGPLLPAVALVAVASAAPAVVLVITRVNPALPEASLLLPLAVFGPIGEEIVFRGYLFRQLHRRAGWGFWAAAGLSALFFGLAHVHGGLDKTLAAPSNVVVPAIGGFFFAWLLLRWKNNLWVPIAVHASMNFWWEMLHSGDAAANRYAQLARGLFVAIVIAKTLRETPELESESPDLSK